MTDYAGMTQLNAVPAALQGTKDRIVYLAREMKSQQLVALQLHPGNSPTSMWLEVLRRLDASLPGLEERCGSCQRPVTAGAKFCPKCGADLSAVPSGGSDEVMEAVKQATAGQYEYLGRMEHGTHGGSVFVVRERSSGRLAALRLHKRSESAAGNQVYDLAGTNVLGRFAKDLGAGQSAPPPDTRLLQAVSRAVGSEYEVLGELGRIPVAAARGSTRVAVAPPPAAAAPAPVQPAPSAPPANRSTLWMGVAAAASILLVALGVLWWRGQDSRAAAVPPTPVPSVPSAPDSATVQIGGELPNTARVTIDGERVRLGMIRLVVGTHEMRAEAPGYQSVVETFDVRPGEVTVWGPSLTRAPRAPPPPPRPPRVAVNPPPAPPPAGPEVRPPPAPPRPAANCATFFTASQDWHKVFQQCETEGQAGGAEAQQILGFLYERGLGTPTNRVMAAQWYQKAADAGNAKAQFYYGRILRDGGGNVRRDREQAVTWFTKAANAGEVDAMSALGRALMRGEGTQKNKSEGVRWYEQAAQRGAAEAQYELAILHKNGDGVAKSDSIALDLMERAARRGHPKAQQEVGKLREEFAKRRRQN